MDVVIFHYHLLPGGVSAVIRQGVRALRDHVAQVSRIQVVAGRVPSPLTHFKELDAEIHRVPEIDYLERPELSAATAQEKARRLAGLLLERFGSGAAVWWIHNYHLGKNPLFTQAVLSIACSADPPRMILQPHDFPEAGRFGNLKALDRVLSLPLYPVGPCIRYALLNPRDLRILRAAGIPSAHLFLLENPVPPLAAAEVEPSIVRKALLPPGAEGVPLLLYPVRAIRRKNVLEAGLLAWLPTEPVQLVVTLPGVSQQERTFSRLVGKAFRSGLIPGVFGAGERLNQAGLRYEHLARVCDLVLSTSIQEGFGFLFVHALQWRLPLLARRLETLDGFGVLFRGYPAFFYPSLACPLETREREGLKTLYRTKLNSLASLIPEPCRRGLEEELLRMLDAEAVDFSYLDASRQLRILKSAASSAGVRGSLREANRELARSLDALLHARAPQAASQVEERFGLRSYAGRIDRLLASFADSRSQEPGADPLAVQRRVREQFARKEYMRLLYG